MSYAHSDDEHEMGRLSEFRKRLAGEVRMQSGVEFKIFQDRKDIAWGQQWKQRIEESLDSVTFLIPIVTPSFLKSTPCREEFELFLEHEKSLARTDLILPVYYVECATLSDEARRNKDRLAAVIAARQYADWRELRFEPFTSPDVTKRLAWMARQVVEALERNRPAPAPSRRHGAGRTSPPNGSDATVESEAALPREPADPGSASEAVSRLSPKTEPPTIVVDGLHRGNHATLSEALKAAKPGHRILVRPGLYREGVVIEKPVEIIGDGALGDVVIEATGKDVVLFRANMGRIANLTLRQTGGSGTWYCVDIAQGRLDLEDCDITSQSSACVGIHGGADPRIRRNRIHDGKTSGVLVYENGQGTLEDNDIFANTFAGVAVTTGGNPAVRHNRIHDGKGAGVHVYQDGQGTVEDNEISANAFTGVEIKSEGNPVVRRNRIHEGKGSGVFVHERGQGTIEDNDIFGNALAGVKIKTEGNPAVRRNRIHECKKAGVFVHERGQGTIEDNDIFANALAGVEVRAGGNPTIRRNRIAKNGYEGAWVYDRGAGTFEENDLRGNTRGPWDIDEACKPNVKRARNIEK